MFIIKHLNTLQHVSIIIQIIFREHVCSLLMSMILKFVKNVKSQCDYAVAAANLRRGADGFYFPSEGRRAENFFARKNPTASAGFDPANLGTKGQQATP